MKLHLPTGAVGFHSEGVYGETERAPHGVELEACGTLQKRRLSQQSEFIYFLPFLPLGICPTAPDVVAEYAYAKNKWITLTYWDLDYELIPSLGKRQIRTNVIFGLPRAEAEDFLNFAQGIVVQDERARSAFRLLVDRYRIIEPGVSLAAPAEKLLAKQLDVFVLLVQTAASLYSLVQATPPTHFHIRKTDEGDPRLWQIMLKFWREDSKPLARDSR